MDVNSENLRFIMGFKLKQHRLENNMSLKELADKTSLSISYLSEIEKGKKYPKPEKILKLAQALGISFDEMVSLQVKKELDPLPIIFSSPVIKEFPFRMYGVSTQDLLALITGTPEKSGALIRTFLEIGQDYDMRVEHLLLSALRSYQHMHHNYFEEIEMAVSSFIKENNWRPGQSLNEKFLHRFLVDTYNYEIDEDALSQYPEAADFRAVWIDKDSPKLLVKTDLTPEQKAFVYAKEIGFNFLKLKERANIVTRMIVQSFEQLLNNFKASYFAAALLMNREQMCKDLKKILSNEQWNGNEFLELIERYEVTPETFMYRLSTLLPQFFGLKNLIFFRFKNQPETNSFELTKLFNMSRIFIPNGIGVKEHYCHRWSSIKLLKKLAALPNKKQNDKPLIAVQRSHFLDLKGDIFSITLAYPAMLNNGSNTSITISFLMNNQFKKTVAFWNDPDIPVVEVNETCERCGLSAEQCSDRAVPSSIFKQQEKLDMQRELLKNIVAEAKR